MIKLSCRECTKRTLGCHSKCSSYLEAKARRDAQNIERQKNMDSYPTSKRCLNRKNVFSTHKIYSV